MPPRFPGKRVFGRANTKNRLSKTECMEDEEPPPIAAMLSKNLQLFIVVRRPTRACACSTELRVRPASVPVADVWVRFSPHASWSGIPAQACCPAPWARQAAGTPSLARALGRRSQLPCGMHLGPVWHAGRSTPSFPVGASARPAVVEKPLRRVAGSVGTGGALAGRWPRVANSPPVPCFRAGWNRLRVL